ncbi:MAG: SLBB domain-containing protein [Candidatus Syntropharchaeia archaeon]
MGAAAEEYLIGPGDLLEVKVYGEPELDRVVRVSSEGFIHLPLIGEVQASDLTVSELIKKVEGKFSEGYLVNPQVSIRILEYNARKVFVLGAVDKPGVYELRGPKTIIELISEAGGIKEGGGNQIVVLRKKKGEQTPLFINFSRLVRGRDMNSNIYLRGGDVVYVPESNEVFILGEVKKPGNYPLKEGMTLIQAITRAGGFTRKAARGRVYIVRDSNQERRIKVDVDEIVKDRSKDIELQPGDVIVVPESIL